MASKKKFSNCKEKTTDAGTGVHIDGGHFPCLYHYIGSRDRSQTIMVLCKVQIHKK